MKKSKYSLALVPDRFAHYRYPVFRHLSDQVKNGFRVVIYADVNEDYSKVKITPKRYCNMNLGDGGVLWKRIHSLYLKNLCVWQTGLLRLAISKRHQVIVYWGEAHRISTWISAIIARVAGKKIVFWTHGIYGNEGYFKRKFRVNFYRLANVLFLYGKHGVKQLTAAGIPKNKLFVINNSLDVQGQLQTIRKFQVEDLKLLRKSLCKDGDKLVVFVGRLEKAKRLDLLLNAVFILKNKSLKIKVVLIGNGNAFRELYDLANKLGILNAVIFYGSCYDDSVVLPILTVSDICVSPGEVGLTAMHSLICGTPVITHDDFSNQMPEFEAIKAGRSGVFFRKGCAEDLAAKISFCLDSVDKGEINEESCREVIKDEYTPEFQRSVFIEAVMPLFS